MRAAFRAVISEGTLAGAAKWLNVQGFKVKPAREGGGLRTRMGFYTVRNLGEIIRSKFYIGIKVYTQNGEKKETEAVWTPIVDRDLFDRANEVLNKNHRRHKETMTDRYPYMLSGLVFCKKCGDRMVEKSAHGNSGKVGYYEHASNTVPGAHVPELQRTCEHVRVQAKLLEPALWSEILGLFNAEKFARELLTQAKRVHQTNPGSKEAEKCNHIFRAFKFEYLSNWCSRADLNRHIFRLTHLKRTCLPISPRALMIGISILNFYRKKSQVRVYDLTSFFMQLGISFLILLPINFEKLNVNNPFISTS
jgi:hypothetical protein